MPTLWLFDIEPHEQRYTCEWQKYLPRQLQDAMASRPDDNWRLEVVSGPKTSGQTSRGAFLDFVETSIYKSHQIAQFSRQLEAGRVCSGDRVLFADAWHNGVLQCRMMAETLGIEFGIDVMWHAGSYDPWDHLAQKISDRSWSYAFESAVFHASDANYFATRFHRDLFFDVLKPDAPERAHIVGWPMEYLPQLLEGRSTSRKKDTILFPHRLAPEKQPEVMKLLEPMLSEFRVVYTMEQNLTKDEYHEELARSVAVFSANLQETLGICPYEGLLCGAVPIVPKRLSYPEMYPTLCYPSEWTISVAAAEKNAEMIVGHIRTKIDDHNVHSLAGFSQWAGSQFFDGRKLYDSVLR